MKQLFTFSIFIIIAGLISCKKECVKDKPVVSDMSFSLHDFQSTADTFITGINYQNTLKFNSDYTWSLNIGNATSTGTFAWNKIQSDQAEIKFNIQHWANYTDDTTFSNKLKNVLLAIDICGYSNPGIEYLNFWNKNCGTFLRTNKK